MDLWEPTWGLDEVLHPTQCYLKVDETSYVFKTLIACLVSQATYNNEDVMRKMSRVRICRREREIDVGENSINS